MVQKTAIAIALMLMLGGLTALAPCPAEAAGNHRNYSAPQRVQPKSRVGGYHQPQYNRHFGGTQTAQHFRKPQYNKSGNRGKSSIGRHYKKPQYNKHPG